jgi:NADPH-dependent 7-cyano-7-deazaguanine reductase QueF-like protein
MILYEKKIEKSGIDCWRSFEYSWLDMKGRPQTGCLEVTIENSSLAINSFELKKKLSLMHQHSFEDAQHALTFIQEILNNQGALVTLKQIEHDINPVHPLSSYTGHYYIRRTVRFLCALTKQPFCGELHIIFANPVSDPEHLDWLLLNSRSKEFMQADYIDDLKNKMIRSVGELLQNQIRVGFYRLQKNLIDESPTTSSQKLTFDLYFKGIYYAYFFLLTLY